MLARVAAIQIDPMPPLREVAKSSEVEDPIDSNVYRPLAYVFVRLVYGTSITPNHITLISTLFGVCAAMAWVYGTATAMIAGGLLLLLSSILDGADGILARVNRLTSQYGRAVDGTADMVVAVTTVLGAFVHIWQKNHQPIHAILLLPAFLSAASHVYLYDYYKELFLRLASPSGSGEGQTLERVTAQATATATSERSTWLERHVMNNYVTMLRFQRMESTITNPGARVLETAPTSERMARIYRKHNARPMRMWSWICLTPHCYLFALFGMFDRLEYYLWLRLGVMNVLFVIVLVWQRMATTRTLREAGLAPAAAPALAQR
jgi:phosphatidylglycerophosphate synthase